jgi:hypothetical protein
MRTPSHCDVQPITDLVTDEEAYEAMQFLDQVAHDFAVAYAEADYRAYLLKQVEAVGALLSDEKANDRRLWEARQSVPYTNAILEVRQAQLAFMEIKARREAAQLKIEVWRTIHADKRGRDVPEPGRRAG